MSSVSTPIAFASYSSYRLASRRVALWRPSLAVATGDLTLWKHRDSELASEQPASAAECGGLPRIYFPSAPRAEDLALA